MSWPTAALMPHLCVLPSQPHSLCSSRWQHPLVCLIGYNPKHFHHSTFHFLSTVFYATHDQHFPSESEERAACWVGFGEHCGDAMTHKPLIMKPRKSHTEVLLDLRSLLLPTIGLHHMEGRFPHLLTLLKIKFYLDHHWDLQKVPNRNRRPLQSSSGPEMMRISIWIQAYTNF